MKSLDHMTEPELKKLFHDLAVVIEYHLPPKTGFVLIAAPFGGAGIGQYLSNGNRRDCEAWMMEVLARWKTGDFVPREGCGGPDGTSMSVEDLKLTSQMVEAIKCVRIKYGEAYYPDVAPFRLILRECKAARGCTITAAASILISELQSDMSLGSSEVSKHTLLILAAAHDEIMEGDTH